MVLRCRGSITIYPRIGLQNSNCQGSKRKWPLTSALFIFFTRKQEENACLYCIKIHATAWHSLVIKTREGEPAKEGEKRVQNREKEKKETKPGRESVQTGAKFVPLFLLKETAAFGAILW